VVEGVKWLKGEEVVLEPTLLILLDFSQILCCLVLHVVIVLPYYMSF
jgi:hypothetical protein